MTRCVFFAIPTMPGIGLRPSTARLRKSSGSLSPLHAVYPAQRTADGTSKDAGVSSQISAPGYALNHDRDSAGTGGVGAGKSAVLGRLYTLSRTDYRPKSRLLLSPKPSSRFWVRSTAQRIFRERHSSEL